MAEPLIEAARAAMSDASVPYSSCPVGAAIETGDGTIYRGCNIEVGNYSNSLHAEELAIGQAVSEGYRTFERIAVTSERRDGLTPCGKCRQTLREFCDEDLVVLTETEDGIDRYTLGELLPAVKGPEIHTE